MDIFLGFNILASVLSVYFLSFVDNFCETKKIRNCKDEFPDDSLKDETIRMFLFYHNLIFVLEILIKSISYGFYFSKKAYLKFYWNKFDFVLTCLPFANYLLGINLISISIRLFRLLKYSQKIKGSKTFTLLNESILNSFSKLFYVGFFICFIILVFSIIAIQMFSTRIYRRCRQDPIVINDRYVSLIDPANFTLVCSSDEECSKGFKCINFYKINETLSTDYKLEVEDEEINKYREFYFGLLSYQHIGIAFLNVFAMLTGELFDVNINTFESQTNFIICRLYSYLVSLFGSLLIIKLLLAIQNEALVNERKEQIDPDRKEEKNWTDKLVLAADEEEMTPAYSRKLSENISEEDSMKDPEKSFTDLLNSKILLKKKDNIFIRLFHVYNSEQYLYFIFYCLSIVIIITNTVFLCLNSSGISEELENNLVKINLTCNVLLILDNCCRLLANFPKLYFKSFYNILDVFLSIMGIVEIIIYAVTDNKSFFLSGFRLLRLFKLLNLFPPNSPIGRLTNILSKSLIDFLFWCIFFFIALLFFSSMGMELFAKRTEVNIGSFNSFTEAVTTTFIISVGNRWTDYFLIFYENNSVQSIIYFLIIVVVNQVFMYNFLLSIIISRFYLISENENEEDLESINIRKKLYSIKQYFVKKFKFKDNFELKINNRKRQGIIQSPENQNMLYKDKTLIEFEKYKNVDIKLLRPLKGRALFYFDTDSKIRQTLVNFINYSRFFSYTILFSIVLSILVILLDSPDSRSEGFKLTLIVFDWILTVIFTLESVLKIIAFGFFFNGPTSYLRNKLDFIDFISLIFSYWYLLTVKITIEDTEVAENNLSINKIIRIIKIFRIFRTFKIIGKSKSLRATLKAMTSSLMQVIIILVFSYMFLLSFGLFAMSFLKDVHSHCTSSPNLTETQCFDQGFVYEEKENNFKNFTNISMFLLDLFLIDGWVGVMQLYESSWNFLFIFLVTIIYYIIYNINMASTIDNYIQACKKLSFFLIS